LKHLFHPFKYKNHCLKSNRPLYKVYGDLTESLIDFYECFDLRISLNDTYSDEQCRLLQVFSKIMVLELDILAVRILIIFLDKKGINNDI